MKNNFFVTKWFIWVLIIFLIIILISLVLVGEPSVGQVPYPGPLPTNAPIETCENHGLICFYQVVYFPLISK